MSGARFALSRWSTRIAEDPGRAARLIVCIGAAWLPGLGLAHAQSSPRATITIEPSIAAGAGTETAFAIQIASTGSLPRNVIVRIYGLPPLAALSAGHSIAPGAWAIPVAAIPDLKVMMPRNASGNADIAVTLVAPDGTVLAEAKSVIAIQAPAPAPAAILRAGTPAPDAPDPPRPPPATGATVPAPAQMSASQRDRAMRLLKKGDEQLAEGGIAQARLLYERAAEAGLASGAMALAATYDPAELERMGVQGLQPDPAAAAKWYERARQLGSVEAAQRLQRLGAR